MTEIPRFAFSQTPEQRAAGLAQLKVDMELPAELAMRVLAELAGHIEPVTALKDPG